MLQIAYETLEDEWLAILRRLWHAYDKPIQKEQFAIYAEELQNIPIGLLEPAIKNIINNSERSNYFPRLSEVRLAISNELKKTLTNGELTDDNITEWLNNQYQQYKSNIVWKRQKAGE